MVIELWHRPWAKLDGSGRRYTIVEGDAFARSKDESGPIWICLAKAAVPLIDGKSGIADPVADLPDGRRIYVLPLPLRPKAGLKTRAGETTVTLTFPGLLDRPREDAEPTGEDERAAQALLTRVKAVWARLRDVEVTLADPATVWRRLEDLWLTEAGAEDPRMDIIVKHARRLVSVLDLIDRKPRRILRRTQQVVPLSRVQELDRKAITWLIRQPGETIAERAGSRQRIRAVVREENFNTLENRVVLSYARLATRIAQDYRNRNAAARHTNRVKTVAAFSRRARTLAQDLAGRGILSASPDVTPNYVLQTNANYHAVWEAWRELLSQERIIDDLWRWQARSWEEFCALALMVAIQSIPGARVIATSPLVFREEQERGCWLRHVNPLGTIHLAEQGVVVEISYRPSLGQVLAPFAAPIWMRVGRLDATMSSQHRWPVWPLWDALGGLVEGEQEEIAAILPYGKKELVRGGIVLRPTASDGLPDERTTSRAASITLGASGACLKLGIERLRSFVVAHVLTGAGDA